MLTPSGEIECGANFTRDTATDSLPLLVSSPFQLSFFFALRSSTVRFVRTNERSFFLSFPLIVESEAPAMVILFLLFSSPFFTLAFLSLPSLYFCLPLPLFSPRYASSVFFFFYWHRFHKYSMAGNVPRDCKTSGRFRLCQGLCAFELDIAKVDVSLARSLGYS